MQATESQGRSAGIAVRAALWVAGVALLGGCSLEGGDGDGPVGGGPPTGEEEQTLTVTPSTALTAVGEVGGPFAPASLAYTLTNTGTADLSWSASADQGWIGLSSFGGTLLGGEEAQLTVSIDQGVAAGLSLGSYLGTVAIVDLGSGDTVERDVLLDVRPTSTGGGSTASALSQFGVRWTFDQPYEVGQFANGDWWVVGPIEVTGITPASTSGGSRHMNGSMVNPSPRNGMTQGYDSTMYAQYKVATDYNPELNVALDVSPSKPLVLAPHSSLVSTISVTTPDFRPQLQSAAILTVLPAPAPAGSFRPPYCGPDKTIRFNESQLRYSLLERLPRVPGENIGLAEVTAMFQRPWLDHVPLWPGRYIHPIDNMPDYGREIVDHVSLGAITLHLDHTDAEKRDLLVGYVQLGIDLYGIAQDGGKHVWIPSAGHMSGRKWPILFAGLMLGDADMSNVGFDKSIEFGEDGQTFYVEETSPGIYNLGYGGYGPQHAGMAEWGTAHANRPSLDDVDWNADPYRQCCTANAWWGQLLAAHVMGAKALWDHDPLFDYQDRYLTEMRSRGVNNWQLSWRDFYLNLWDAYRPNY